MFCCYWGGYSFGRGARDNSDKFWTRWDFFGRRLGHWSLSSGGFHDNRFSARELDGRVNVRSRVWERF